ncbi:MAG: hypothetical protein ACI4ET_11565 [Bilifractor sp.]
MCGNPADDTAADRGVHEEVVVFFRIGDALTGDIRENLGKLLHDKVSGFVSR